MRICAWCSHLAEPAVGFTGRLTFQHPISMLRASKNCCGRRQWCSLKKGWPPQACCTRVLMPRGLLLKVKPRIGSTWSWARGWKTG